MLRRASVKDQVLVANKPSSRRNLRGAGWGTRLAVLLACALLIGNPLLAANSEKVAENLKATDPGATVSVLIHFKQAPSESEHQSIQSLGGQLRNSAATRNSENSANKVTESYALPAGALDDIAKDTNVSAITRDDSSEGAYGGAVNASSNTASLTPQQKISQDLQNLDPSKPVNVIVQYTDGPTDANHEMVAAQGGTHVADLALVKGAMYSVSPSALKEIAKRPNVAYITPDRQIRRTMDHYNYATGDNVAFSAGWDGTGVGVAVIDSGVYAHADLNTYNQNSSRIVYSQSFVPGDSNTSDEFGHGTHVAGIIGGNGASSGSSSNYSTEYQGIAPNAQIINLRVLDQFGVSTDSEVIAAINCAIQLQNTYNIGVINLSLGRPVFESYQYDPLDQAVEAAWAAGIVVVVAAGNSGRDSSFSEAGYGTINAPGNDPFVITVGATSLTAPWTEANQQIASYSSKGPTLIDHIAKPDLVAPGNNITSLLAPGSTLATAFPQYDVFPCNSLGVCGVLAGQPSYMTLSGTSMATPVVSGTVALMLQQNPNLTPDQVKARLMKSAYKGYQRYVRAMAMSGAAFNEQHDIFAVGAGELNITAALANTDLAPAAAGSAESPTVVLNNNNGNVELTINGNAVIWGNSVIWGQAVVWGNSVLSGVDSMNGLSVIWGDAVVWGNSADSAFSVIWGQSVIWGDSGLQALADGDGGDSN
jgi:serine protease AprX